jgi:hypothetical protein
MTNVSSALIHSVRAQLQQDERLAWAMCPEPLAFERPAVRRKGLDALVILGGGYATLASIWMALRHGNAFWLAVPISIVLVGILVYLLAQRRKARGVRILENTVFVLTTRRALIVRMFPRGSVHALPIESITDVTLSDPRRECADLNLVTAESPAGLVFAGVHDPERARTHLMSVIRDPGAADREIAASARYMAAMQQLVRRGP